MCSILIFKRLLKYIVFFCLFFIKFNFLHATTIDIKSLQNNTSILNKSAFRKIIKQINLKNNTKIESRYIVRNNDLNDLETESIGIPVGEEIMLSLYIDKYYLSDLFGYKTKENAQISLTNLFELLDFPIDIALDEKKVSGWFISEKNNFKLELPSEEGNSAKVTINGIETTLLIENYYIADEDLYVDADVISDWFGFDMTFDFNGLNLALQSSTPLPIQAKLARENKRLYNDKIEKSVLPWKDSSYQAISSPLVDVQLNAFKRKNSKISTGYSILSAQDFAYFNTQLYLSGDDQEHLSNIRLKFAKEDPTGGLLGPLNAYKYEFGDISSVSGAGNIGRGFKVLNKKNDVENNQTKTFSGDIQPGWDIELYRNNVLIKKQLSSEEGRYSFDDVELFFGQNNFELIFYGPQGQVRTEKEEIFIDQNELKKRESNYEFSVVDLENKLFKQGYDEERKSARYETSLKYNLGLTDLISLNSSFINTKEVTGETSQNYSLGASFNVIDNLLFGISLSMDQDQHKGLSFNARTILADQSLNFDFSLNDAYDPNDPSKNDYSEAYNLSMQGRLFNEYPLPISYLNKLSFSNNKLTHSKETYLRNTIGMSTPFARLSHLLDWKSTSSQNITNTDFKGSLNLSKRFSGLSTNFTVNYEIEPEFKFNSFNLKGSKSFRNNINSELSFDYYPKTSHYKSRLSLGIPLDLFNLQTYLDYDKNDDWSVGISTQFSLGYEPVSKTFIYSKSKLSDSGLLIARVFEDQNSNGVLDEGENLLPNIDVKAVQISRSSETDDDGIAVLKSLPNNIKTDIVIDRNSIEDPYLIPASSGFSMTPRTGFIEIVDIPIVNAGELDGTVYLKDSNGDQVIGAYLTINLHDQDGNLVATTDSEFDGYYLFTSLLPGKYTASISEKDIKRKKLRSVEAKEFNFSANGDVIAGADFIIDRFTFVEGFVVELGEFNSLVMLKAYWQIIQEKYDDALKQQVFYIFDEETNKYHLNAGFFKTESQAERANAFVHGKEISSSVKEFTFNI